MRVMVAALLLVSALAGAGRAGAHGVDISVLDDGFAPSEFHLVAETQHVSWEWGCSGGECGTHNVTAYRNGSFASGDRSAPDAFEVEVTATEAIRYRCTIHSTLDETGCKGMCGVIYPRDRAKPDGSISKPGRDEVLVGAAVPVPVAFAGSASDDVGVRSVTVLVSDIAGTVREHPTRCEGCGERVASWEAEVDLLPGVYRTWVVVVDADGKFGSSSVRRFVVV